MSATSVREFGYLFLTMSSLHIIVPDLDVRDHCFLEEYPWMMSNPITKTKDLLLYNNMLNYSKSADVK